MFNISDFFIFIQIAGDGTATGFLDITPMEAFYDYLVSLGFDQDKYWGAFSLGFALLLPVYATIYIIKAVLHLINISFFRED